MRDRSALKAKIKALRDKTKANDGTTYAAADLAYPDGARYGEAIRAGHDKAHLTSIYRVGKKAAGRLLDGVEHNGMPDRAPALAGAA